MIHNIGDFFKSQRYAEDYRDFGISHRFCMLLSVYIIRVGNKKTSRNFPTVRVNTIPLLWNLPGRNRY